MLKIILKGFNYQYDLIHLTKLFFDTIEFSDDIKKIGYELYIFKENNEVNVSLFLNGNILFREKSVKIEKNEIKKMVYEALSSVKETNSKYGILVGVRPEKVVNNLLDKSYSKDKIRSILSSDYKISNEKIDLLLSIAFLERDIAFKDYDKISIYISIPFCPSICSYCSFPSNDINKKSKLVRPYIEKLIIEIQKTFELVKMYNMEVDVVYIGGGTPSSIPIEEIEKVFESLKSNIDLKSLKEFTFEAGRPETISSDKLKLMEKYGVTRICVNPQTFNDNVLEIIGRKHFSEDIFNAYKNIKLYEFDSINMDLIVGLPGDNLDSFKRSINSVIDLDPDNVTVHTLSIKKASDIKKNPELYILPKYNEIQAMLDYAYEKLSKAKYIPYYMYRQKNILGNFENIGYSKKGKESIYNIRIIEERHTIVALGVGGVSKAVINKDKFERIPNFKSVEDYIERFDEMIDRKKKVFALINN